MAVAAAKADQPSPIVQFAKSAAGAIAVERELHGRYFQKFHLSADNVAARTTGRTPTA